MPFINIVEFNCAAMMTAYSGRMWCVSTLGEYSEILRREMNLFQPGCDGWSMWKPTASIVTF